MNPLRRTLLAGLAILALAAPAGADTLPAPADTPILTVTGSISQTNADDAAVFDLAALDALPQTAFETSTIWTEGVASFSGVALADLLDALGADGETLVATALNDYAVEIPLSDGIEGGPILATRMDGAPMSVRDKGPIWIVYPFDSREEYRSETIYSRSIWQLRDLEIRR